MKTLLPVLVGVALALASAAGSAEETDKDVLKLSIERKSLRDALNDWAQQTGYQLIAEIKGEFVAPKIEGRLTAQEALERLLQGTPLTYQWMGERLVAVKEKPLVVPAALQSTRSEADERRAIRVAKLSGDEWEGARLAAGDARVAQNDAGTGATRASRDAESDVEELEEVFVTGTHIRGIQNSTSALTVLDRPYIESTGIGTTTGLIESLPQNFSLASQSGVLVPGVSDSGAQGSSINLRGLGEGTTLVLLNGRRMPSGFSGSAVDISALPLSAIERVEILTDGASAIYGSDAVGGVVNFILRRDFDGAETRLRSGWADGVNELGFSQALGTNWGSGNVLISGEYYKRDLLRSSERDFVPDTSDIGSLNPEDENYSVMLSARQDIASQVSIFVDALYTNRDSYNEGGRITFGQNFSIENPQYTATLGLEWLVTQNWRLDLSASRGRYKLDQVQRSTLLADLGLGASLFESEFDTDIGQVNADGPVFALPGGDVRLAVGAEWRQESFENMSRFSAFDVANFHADSEQTVRSAFAELHIPVVGTANAGHGIRRLDVSLSGRFDDYSNFGSSVDPRIGIMWEPMEGLRLRGSYGTSYRAPNLVDYDVSANSGVAALDIDPGVPAGFSNVFSVLGSDASSLTAQDSKNLSFGLEFSPQSIEGLSFAIGYYSIDFTDRIGTPPQFASIILGNPSSFADLIVRDPSAQEVLDFIAVSRLGQGFFVCDAFGCTQDPADFDPASIDVIVDGRKRNLSEVKTSGLDVSTSYAFETAGGTLSFGVVGTYIHELKQKLTASSDEFDSVDTFNNPPDFRIRGSLGWQRGGWNGNIFVNHTDSYEDNRFPEPRHIASYTTVDMRLAYAFGTTNRSLSGLTVALAMQNAFDRDPPHTSAIFPDTDLGFDPTNANPMGRLLSVELVKSW